MVSVVVLTGGGIKSAVAAGKFADEHELILVHADHGQPSASAEVKAVTALAERLPNASVVALTLPHVDELQRWTSSRRGSQRAGVPPAGGEAESDAGRTVTLRGLMPVLLSVGVQCALRVGASTVVTGLSRLCEAAHLGLPPVEGSSEGRRQLLDAFNLAIQTLVPQRSKMRVDAPLMDLGYVQIIKLAQHFGAALERTWSCGRSGPRPCERCASCSARATAFREAVMVDPLHAKSPVSA